VTTSSVQTVREDEEEEGEDAKGEEPLLHPNGLCDGIIPNPKSLSPSSILEFRNCPQSFLFQYLYGLRQPTSPALAKGSLCHAALEQLFDLKPPDRNLEHLQNLFRKAWAERRNLPEYSHLFESVDEERAWGIEGLHLLENYARYENPEIIQPAQREVWVRANLSVDPSQGVTGYATSLTRIANNDGHNKKNETLLAEDGDDDVDVDRFLVRGIVDRLDLVRSREGSGRRRDAGLEDDSEEEPIVMRIVDYKTGKAPDLKYSPAMNQKIRDEAFFQLKIYALLMRESRRNGRSSPSSSSTAASLPVRFLRLFYLTNPRDSAECLEYDLGPTQRQRDAELQEVHASLSNTWTDILDLVSMQDPKAFVGCQRSFCYCHNCRARFVPGTVWEPSD